MRLLHADRTFSNYIDFVLYCYERHRREEIMQYNFFMEKRRARATEDIKKTMKAK